VTEAAVAASNRFLYALSRRTDARRSGIRTARWCVSRESMPTTSAQAVLDFWFGAPPADEHELVAHIVRWFRGSDALDREVVRRFAGTVETAVRGGFRGWESTPRGRLALVILLDQLTRNIHRGSPRAHAGDARAQAIALAAFDDGSAGELAFVEQVFLSLPLLHSELLVHQEREAEIAKTIAAEAPPLYQPMAAMLFEQSAKFRAVVARFGRFPHRNALLGRLSTPEEIAFLLDWDAMRPPAGMPDRPADRTSTS
jgi:uncharacterized protein (DUF924 family)